MNLALALTVSFLFGLTNTSGSFFPCLGAIAAGCILQVVLTS